MIDYLENGTLIKHPKLGECKVIGVETMQNNRYYIIQKLNDSSFNSSVSERLLKNIKVG